MMTSLTKKDKIQLAVTAGFLAILVVSLAKGCQGQGRKSPKAVAIPMAGKKEPPAKEKPLKEAAPAVKEKSSDRVPAPAQVTGVDRDPFSKPDVPAQPARRGLRLDGIAFDDETPTAIINGKIVKAGSAIENYFVISITENSVVLSDGTNVITLLTDY
jgi:hypothetical protein